MNSVALVGMPNVGKTALFNALTGSFQKVANFPGVTVEKKMAHMSLPQGEGCELVDLPGLYSLDVATLDEKVARDWLTGKIQNSGPLILVLDSTHLQKSIYLLLQILELGHRPVIALTQMDQSQKRGQILNFEKLSQLSGCTVIPVSAITGEGLPQLKEVVGQSLHHFEAKNIEIAPDYQKRIKNPLYVSEKFKTIDMWLKEVIQTPLRPDSLTARLDSLALHPIGGFFVLFGLLFLMFQALFSWAGPAQDLIEAALSFLGTQVGQLITHPLLHSLIVDGIIGGVGGVIVFLPQILLLFLFIQFLEDVGYLGRAAFLMDGFMRKLGLPGKAMIPLLSSHACAIPGVLATRILEDRRERLVAMMVIPLTTCSARLPVFTLLIAAIIPSSAHLGPFSYQGIAMMSLYVFPMISSILVAAVLRKVMPHEAPSMLLMELPPYRLPKLRHLARTLMNKAQIFVSKAGKVILLLSLVIWALVSFPRHENGSMGDIEHSYAAVIGKAFTPIFAPLGFDWKINTALVPAMGAREVLVAALSTVYAVEGDEESQASQLTSVLGTQYSLATLASLIVWFVFAPQCISTIAVIKRESGSWAAPLGMVAYTLVLAWVMAFLTYRILL
ncbi:MAG: ferrous iron transporter B [Bacteriovoracaceae bacterium]|nr:ferrous iron transporter B [Bacteriovoracaceae bacterium]